ncbi:hypothetical protein P692DRAFT_20144157 [Suillus brevipes Sb2]|nr:hypothetical protein P692DRAFT_20144157 [Suillus brevipes Sb2]
MPPRYCCQKRKLFMVLLFSLRDQRSASSMPLFTPDAGMRIKLGPITSLTLHPGFDNPVNLSILTASLLGEPAFHFYSMNP